MTDQKKTLVSTLCLLLTSVIWGLAFVAQLQGMEFMGSLTYGGVRFAMGTLSLVPLIFLFERRSGGKQEVKLTLRYGALTGVILFCASTLQQFGIELTQSAGKAGFITGLYTVLTPIFGLFLGKKTTKMTAVGAVLAFTGLFFLSMPVVWQPVSFLGLSFHCFTLPGGFGSINLGDGLLILGAVFWTLHIMAVDAFAVKVRPIRFSAVQFGTCAILSLCAMCLFEQPSIASIQAGIVPLLYGGLLSVGVAYTLQIVGQRHVEPSKAAIIFSLESLFAALGGFLLLQEMLGLRGFLGGALMFLGIILSQLNGRKQAP